LNTQTPDGSASPPLETGSSAGGLATSDAVVDRLAPVALPPWIELNRRPRFEVLQAFEGTVTELTELGFVARLVDRTDPRRPSEYGDFDLQDVSDADQPLVQPGAVFYWTIGYRVHPWGQKERSGPLVFRRLPAWTGRDLERAKGQAKAWRYLLGEDESG
jgi:hypothetical protein